MSINYYKQFSVVDTNLNMHQNAKERKNHTLFDQLKSSKSIDKLEVLTSENMNQTMQNFKIKSARLKGGRKSANQPPQLSEVPELLSGENRKSEPEPHDGLGAGRQSASGMSPEVNRAQSSSPDGPIGNGLLDYREAKEVNDSDSSA